MCESPTKEEAAIQKLRSKISDVISSDKKFNDDLYLLQWLKAQKFNPDMAEDMIRESIAWRQELNLHSRLAEEFPPEYIAKMRAVFSKAADGTPILYVNIGSMDLKYGVTSLGKQHWVLYWSMIMADAEEKMIAFNKGKNANCKRITSDSTRGLIAICNSKNFSSLQLLNFNVIRCSLEVAGNLLKYFPALVDTMFFYNMNAVFKVLFTAIKPILTVPYIKMEVCGTDEEVWQKKLVQITNSEEIDALYIS